VKILIVMVMMLSLYNPCQASVLEEENQKAFIDYLFQKKYYSQAIIESERLLFNYPESRHKHYLLILIGDCYAFGGDEQTAHKKYQEFISENPDSPLLPTVYLRVGKLFANSRNYKAAISYFKKIPTNIFSSDNEIKKAKTWILLLTLLDEGANEAKGKSKELSLDNDNYIQDMFKSYDSLVFKSPKIAGTLSAILPGAGQLYLDRNRDALTAFILNGLFIWGIVESFDKGNTATGIILSVFEVGWYGGNIYSAVNGAYKHNRKLKDSFKNRMSIQLNIGANNATIPSLRLVYFFD